MRSLSNNFLTFILTLQYHSDALSPHRILHVAVFLGQEAFYTQHSSLTQKSIIHSEHPHVHDASYKSWSVAYCLGHPRPRNHHPD